MNLSESDGFNEDIIDFDDNKMDHVKHPPASYTVS